MKKLLLLIFIALSSSIVKGQNATDTLIRLAFSNYKTAILNDKGVEAANSVDSRTLKFYDKIATLTKDGDSAQVSDLPLIEKLTVLMLRHKASKEQIRSLDGRGTLIYAIENGMVGKNSVANISIGKVTIDGNFAKAQMISRGMESPFFFHFYQEEGTWKIDLTSMFPTTSAMLKMIIDGSGKDPNQYILELIELTGGKKPEKSIWDKID